MAFIKLPDGHSEFINDERQFDELILSYMGFDAWQYFIEEILAERDRELTELKQGRAEIEKWVLQVLLPTLRPNDCEELAEEFKAKVEDVYGL